MRSSRARSRRNMRSSTASSSSRSTCRHTVTMGKSSDSKCTVRIFSRWCKRVVRRLSIRPSATPRRRSARRARRLIACGADHDVGLAGGLLEDDLASIRGMIGLSADHTAGGSHWLGLVGGGRCHNLAVGRDHCDYRVKSSHALPTAPRFVGGKVIAVVLDFFMACLSFVDSTPRAYRLKASSAAPLFSTSTGAIRGPTEARRNRLTPTMPRSPHRTAAQRRTTIRSPPRDIAAPHLDRADPHEAISTNPCLQDLCSCNRCKME